MFLSKWILIGMFWFNGLDTEHEPSASRQRIVSDRATCLAISHEIVNSITEKQPTTKVATICASADDLDDGEIDDDTPANFYNNFGND